MYTWTQHTCQIGQYCITPLRISKTALSSCHMSYLCVQLDIDALDPEFDLVKLLLKPLLRLCFMFEFHLLQASHK